MLTHVFQFFQHSFCIYIFCCRFKYCGNDFINIDSSVLGFIDPNITVNVVSDEKIAKKITLSLPEKVENIIKCKNPRCITTTENYVAQKFKLVDKAKAEYACEYCDQIHKAGTDF